MAQMEDANDKILQEINQIYAVAPVGNKYCIVENSMDETRFLTPTDFNLALQNRFVTVGSGKSTKQEALSKYWLSNPNRRAYKKVDFIPSFKTPPEVFNLWRGFAVKPKGELDDIPHFHELLVDVICSSNERWFNYLWGWLAHMVQFPEDKPSVAVVMRSDAQGVGKSRFADYVGSLLGRHFRPVAHGHHIHGNFNSHLKDTLLLFGDEAVWGGDKSTESILKQMISEPTMIVEMKGKDVFEIKNYLRLMLATNSDWAAPVSLTDRRYFVLDVSESRRNDYEFFKKLKDEQNNGGSEALLQTLMDFDLNDFEVRDIPETPARLDQKLLSMKTVEKWWLSILNNEEYQIEEMKLNFDEENRVVISDLSNSFNSYAKLLNIRHRHWSVQMFCGHFRKLVPNVDVRRRGSTKREYQFPSLNECKMYFREKYSLGSDLFEIN